MPLSSATVDALRQCSFEEVKRFITEALKELLSVYSRVPAAQKNLLLRCVHILNCKAPKGESYYVDFTLCELINTPAALKSRIKGGANAATTQFGKILEHFKRQQELRVDFTYRLHRLYDVLEASSAAGVNFDGCKLARVGLEEYVIFFFDNAQIAILECPVVGNAMYVVQDSWYLPLVLNKSDLTKQDAERFIHDRGLLPQVFSLIKTNQLQAKLRVSRID